MQNAFSAAPLHASLPAIAAGEPLAGIALGIVVFGDRVQITPGMLAIEAGGIAALIVGVIAVARSSAFSGLRKVTGVITPGSHRDPRIPDQPGAHRSRIRTPRRRSADAAPVNGVFRDDPPARKVSRPAHRRQVHESPSGGDGR
jgi:hypothetical protein